MFCFQKGLSEGQAMKGRNVNTRVLSGLWSEGELHRLLRKQFLGFHSGIGKWFYERDKLCKCRKCDSTIANATSSFTKKDATESFQSLTVSSPAAETLAGACPCWLTRWHTLPGLICSGGPAFEEEATEPHVFTPEIRNSHHAWLVQNNDSNTKMSCVHSPLTSRWRSICHTNKLREKTNGNNIKCHCHQPALLVYVMNWLEHSSSCDPNAILLYSSLYLFGQLLNFIFKIWSLTVISSSPKWKLYEVLEFATGFWSSSHFRSYSLNLENGMFCPRY